MADDKLDYSVIRSIVAEELGKSLTPLCERVAKLEQRFENGAVQSSKSINVWRLVAQIVGTFFACIGAILTVLKIAEMW